MAYRESLIIYDHIEDDNNLKKLPERKKLKNNYSLSSKVLFVVEELVILALLITMILMIK